MPPPRSPRSRRFTPVKAVRVLVVLALVAVMALLAAVPLDWKAQGIVGAILFLIGWIMNRSSPAKRTTLALVMLATFATTRYAYWRIWQTVTYVRSGQPY